MTSSAQGQPSNLYSSSPLCHGLRPLAGDRDGERDISRDSDRDGVRDSGVTAGVSASSPGQQEPVGTTSILDVLEPWERARVLSVLRVVEQRTGVSAEQMLGRSQLAWQTQARHQAMYAMRHHIALGWAMIGRILNRDKTSVLKGVQRLEALARVDGGLREELREL